MPDVNVDDFEDICFDSDPVILSGGTPSGGTYSGAGVENGTFYPDRSGSGTFTIFYEYTDPTTTCTNLDSAKIIVHPLPEVTSATFSPVCVDAEPFTLEDGTPVGGTYSGNGVGANNVFDPSMAGVGEHSLTYTFVIEATSCVGYDTTTIIVNALPAIEIETLDDVCEDAEPFILNIATPEGGNYSGNRCKQRHI